MITSSATGPALDKLRRLSGPNPEGSKLDEVERLHLIFLLGAMVNDDFGADVRTWVARFTIGQLEERGLSGADLYAIFDDNSPGYSAVDVADMIAVHPALKHPYLD